MTCRFRFFSRDWGVWTGAIYPLRFLIWSWYAKTGFKRKGLIFGKEESPLQKLRLFIKHVHTNFTGQRRLLLGKTFQNRLDCFCPGAFCRFVMRQRSNHHGSLRKTSPNPSSKSRNQEQYWFVQDFLKLSPERKDKFCHSFNSYRYTSKCPIGNGALETNIDFWCHAVCYQEWLGNFGKCFPSTSSDSSVKSSQGGGFKYVLFSPLLGEMIQID